MIETAFNQALQELTDGSVPDRSYLLGVSGGIDSICMAELFLRSPFHPRFAVAHVNFSLRGEDSIADMNSVREWAERNSVPFHTVTFDTPTYAAEHSLSTQMAARELRYNWFEKIMDSEGYDYLSIAHNLDDSIETIFINLVRGTGIKGVSGIRARNGRIIRPLLEVTRKQITRYVAEHGISYRDDRTNFESHYSRNRIRNIIFPEFRKINPSFLKTVAKESLYFTQVEEIVEDLYLQKRDLYFREENGKIMLSTDLVRKEKQADYWLYRFLKEYGFRGVQIPEISRCVQEGQNGKSFSSVTHEIVLNRGTLNIYPLQEEKEEVLALTEPGLYSFRGRTFKLDMYPRPDTFRPVPTSGELFFSLDEVMLPLTCRGWRFADKFRPFGMKAGSKKLSDFYTDLKFDKYQKNAQPVLEDAKGHIVCLPGLRIDDRYKIKTSTNIVAEVVFVD